jgi:hypothetical protein
LKELAARLSSDDELNQASNNDRMTIGQGELPSLTGVYRLPCDPRVPASIWKPEAFEDKNHPTVKQCRTSGKYAANQAGYRMMN